MSLLSKFFGKKPQIQKTKTTDNIAFYCVYLADTYMPFLDGMSIVISKKAEVPQIVKDKPSFNLQLYMVAIKEAEKETFFLDCYSSGYGDIWFDGEEKHISDYITIPQKEFKNRELCLEMVKVGQIRAIISHTVDKTPAFFLRQQANEQMSQMIFQKLLESELYTVDQENSKYLATAVVTTPRHKGKWIALFTDALAAKKIYGEATCLISFDGILTSQLSLLNSNSEIDGVMINPYREEFFIPKIALQQHTDK